MKKRVILAFLCLAAFGCLDDEILGPLPLTKELRAAQDRIVALERRMDALERGCAGRKKP